MTIRGGPPRPRPTPKPRYKKYTVDFSFNHNKWCVFAQMTASIRTVYQACRSKDAAEKLADKLNREGK